MSANFRRDKSKMTSGRECVLAFDGPAIEAFQGSNFEIQIGTESAKFGFGQAGVASTETLPIDADTDEVMAPTDAKPLPTLKHGGFRHFVRLQKMFG